jgi:hypothetical protein
MGNFSGTDIGNPGESIFDLATPWLGSNYHWTCRIEPAEIHMVFSNRNREKMSCNCPRIGESLRASLEI